MQLVSVRFANLVNRCVALELTSPIRWCVSLEWRSGARWPLTGYLKKIALLVVDSNQSLARHLYCGYRASSSPQWYCACINGNYFSGCAIGKNIFFYLRQIPILCW